ncbi:hypothetical protein [Tsukamurella soli]|uniref:hypothetical protein n=1 Tax=Tsukamurella soli TaxID=644556 RepID=UPI00361A79B7
MTCVWDIAFADTGHPGRRGPAGAHCTLEEASGSSRPLPVSRWLHGDHDDDALLAAVTAWCTGPAVDLGCGPGRVVDALLRRGSPHWASTVPLPQYD